MMDEDLLKDAYSACDECAAYGDDYSIDEYGELVCNCENCPCHEIIYYND